MMKERGSSSGAMNGKWSLLEAEELHDEKRWWGRLITVCFLFATMH